MSIAITRQSPLRPWVQRLLVSAAVLLPAAPAQAHGEHAAARPAAVATPAALPPLRLSAGDDAVLARVDGERIGSNALALLQRYLALDGRPADTQGVLAEVIEQRLLARHAAQRYPAAELFPEQRVAFAPEVGVDDKLVGLLRTVYREPLESALPAEAGDRMAKIVQARARVDAAQLRSVLGDPQRIRVEYTLDATQRKAADALELVRYALPGGERGRISLADIYARQNVQGRISLHQLDADFLAARVDERLQSLLVVDWAKRQVGADAVAELRRNLSDRDYARALLAQYGLGTDMHDTRPHIDTLRRAVDAAEIQRWYTAHRERFRRLERVRARHIRLADEATALQVARTLRPDGSNFAELARRHSVAPDAAGGGELGWLDSPTGNDWLRELIFAQPLRQTGAPVREPAPANAAAAWEIVRVEEQRHGYHPGDSETVRYLASQAIAEQKARQEFSALNASLRGKARIVLAAAAASR